MMLLFMFYRGPTQKGHQRARVRLVTSLQGEFTDHIVPLNLLLSVGLQVKRGSHEEEVYQ